MAARQKPTAIVRECIICVDSHPQRQIVKIQDSNVCHGCVREMFEAAILDEERYPPKWGSKVLEITDFRMACPPELRERFADKEKEYNAPPYKRIYCMKVPNIISNGENDDKPCGAYIGVIDADWEDSLAAGIIPRIRCKKCKTPHCKICRELFTYGHECMALPDQQKEDSLAFEGLVKGKDYQICPSGRCQRKIQLIDGCNDTSCICGQRFCFVCGNGIMTEAHFDQSKEAGGCPRFNHPSMPNATWNEDMEDEAADFEAGRQVLRRFLNTVASEQVNLPEDMVRLIRATMLLITVEEAPPNGERHDDAIDRPPRAQLVQEIRNLLTRLTGSEWTLTNGSGDGPEPGNVEDPALGAAILPEHEDVHLFNATADVVVEFVGAIRNRLRERGRQAEAERLNRHAGNQTAVPRRRRMLPAETALWNRPDLALVDSESRAAPHATGVGAPDFRGAVQEERPRWAQDVDIAAIVRSMASPPTTGRRVLHRGVHAPPRYHRGVARPVGASSNTSSFPQPEAQSPPVRRSARLNHHRHTQPQSNRPANSRDRSTQRWT